MSNSVVAPSRSVLRAAVTLASMSTRLSQKSPMGTTVFSVPLTLLGTNWKSVPSIRSRKVLLTDHSALLAASLMEAASEEKCVVLGWIILHQPAYPAVTRT
jgi:hypothetical protein